ncbi:ribonuclease H family protein [Micropruina sonneratiae]|uniref:ribonuclease H family protein n=1 Tax=Micropruina sonneratiae TaxID=2986940 RepID=UPI00222660E3|nr:ribonuclease H [Micropruina sp. KQZ13P-5]MCW3159596.1 ribonuclease HI [Micropruina sp. KQZ13P-5]
MRTITLEVIDSDDNALSLHHGSAPGGDHPVGLGPSGYAQAVSPDRIVVATDGSCLGNPGPGGWAWASEEGRSASGGHPGTTNNLMELRAVYEALKAHDPATPLLIQADSMYVINTFTEWLHGWVARGWRTASKKPVQNRRAIELVATELNVRDVQWEHVKGHAGHALNEKVDLLARGEATQLQMQSGN